MEPRHVHPLQWQQAVDVARAECARAFADGRSPADATQAFGLAPSGAADWARTVNVIAEVLCTAPATLMRAA